MTADQQAADDQPDNGQTADDQSVSSGQPADDQAAGDELAGDQTAGDPADGGQAAADQPDSGQAADDQATGDQPDGGDGASDQSDSDQAGDGQAASDQPDGGDAAGDQSAEGQAADGQSTGSGQAADGQAVGDQAADGQSAGDQAAGDQSAGDQAAGDQSGSGRSDGQAAGGQQAADGGPPYLIVDQYPLDSGPRPPWPTVVSTAGFCGVILKAWEGTQYNDNGWFSTNWPAVRDAGGGRYGVSWFRGAYLFLRFATSGSDQADAYLKAIDQAGGWDHGDIIPIIDVELGDAKNPANLNAKATPQQIVDCTTQCANRIRQVTGKRIMLYGRGAMRDLKITDHMGCDVVWNPSYTAQMARTGLESWALEDIVLWQYCGDNVSALPNYPHMVTGFNKVDISVYVKGAQKPTLQMVRESLLPS